MKIIRYRVLLSQKSVEQDAIWKTGTERIELDDIITISVNEAVKDKSGSFSITLKVDKINNIYQYVNDIHVEDVIQIYAWYEGDTFTESSTLLMDGLITKIEFDENQKGKYFKITGQDRLAFLLRYQLPSGYTASGVINTVPLIIQNLLDKLRYDFQQENSIVWDTVNNPTTKQLPGGEVFPNISYMANWKTVYEQISELSTSKYTQDGNYTFWIESRDNVNYFRWGPKNFAIRGNIKLGEITTIANENSTLSANVIPIQDNIKKGIYDILNFIIINVGEDSNGNGIITWVTNIDSMKRHGTKSKYVTDDEATNLFKFERNNNSTYWTNTDSRLPDSFPYDTAWLSTRSDTESPVATIGASVTCTDASDFIKAFRRECKWKAHEWGQHIVDIKGKETYKASYTLELGTNAVAKNGIYSVESDALLWNNDLNTAIKLRLMQIKHTLSDTGWLTTLELDEDPAGSE